MFSEEIDPHRDPSFPPVSEDRHSPEQPHSEENGHSNNTPNHKPNQILNFTVGRLVDRSKRQPAYTFHVVTNITSFKRRKYSSIERNQIEFERLEAHLRATYPECLVPTLGTGSTVSKYIADYQNDRLVVALLQQWLDRISAHSILRQDYELRQFVEAPFAFNPTNWGNSSWTGSQGPQQSESNTAGFFSWGKSKPKVSYGANSTPFEQFLEKMSSNLDHYCKNLADTRRWHGRVARSRGRLSVDLRDIGTKLLSVGVIEHNADLARAFKRAGKCFVHMGACAQTQANMEGSRTITIQDMYTIACDNAQRTMMNRQSIFTEHRVAERQLERKRQSVAVLRASTSINPDQVDQTLAEMEGAKDDADVKRERAERVDRVLAADLQMFERNREVDIKNMFEAYAKEQQQIEKQILGDLKGALAAIRQSNGHHSYDSNGKGAESLGDE